MKRLTFQLLGKVLLALIPLLIPLTSSALTVDIENDDGVIIFYYINMNTSSHEVTVVSDPESEYRYEGVVTIPDTVLYDYRVTSIGKSAFSGCSGLTSLTIPNSITSIGDYAFNGCTSLTDLTIEDGESTLKLGYYNNSYNGTGKGLFYDCPLEKLYLGRNLSYDSSQRCGYSPFYGKSSLKELTIGNSVTSIENYAFNGCTSLTDLTIEDGESTLKLGYKETNKGLFYDCPLEKLYLGRNLSYDSNHYPPFYNKSTLKELTIGNSVTSIENYAFNGCTSLTDLTIEDGESTLNLGYNYHYVFNDIKGTGKGLFYDCPLEKIYLGRQLSYYSSFRYGYSPFYGKSTLKELTIGNSVTSIESNAFNGCTSLTDLRIEDGESTLELGYNYYIYNNYNNGTGRGLFYDCPLEKLYLGRNLSYYESQGNPAFYNKSLLKELTIGKSVTTIGDCAFYGCSGLTSLTIPDSVTSIGDYAFYHCSGLTSLTIPDSVTSIGDGAFCLCSGLKSLTIPDPITSIGNYTFSGCSGLTSLTIPESVTSIGNYAFEYCSGLTSLTIPNSVTSIEDHTFYGCSRLTSLTIGNSVNSIGSYAFYGCNQLSNVRSWSIKPPTLASNPFSSIKFHLIVPTLSAELYEESSWKNYAIFIADIEKEGIIYRTNGNQANIIYCDYNYRLDIPSNVTIEDKSYMVTSIDTNLPHPETLQTLVIPNTMKYIAPGTFKECINLNKIIIYGNSVPEGLMDAFAPKSDRVTYVSSDKYQDYAAVLGRVVVENSLSSSFMSDGVLYVPQISARTCTAIDYNYETEEVTVADEAQYKGVKFSVRKIGQNAFRNNATLKSIAIGGGIEEVGIDAFSCCDGLLNVTLADSAEPLKLASSFDGPITTLTVDRDIKSDVSLTTSRERLINLTVAGHATKVRSIDFAGRGRQTLTNLTLGDMISEIGDNTFMDCSLLETPVELGASVQRIGANAFKNCKKIPSASIEGNGNATIDDSAFDGCSAMETITLGEGVTQLGNDLFKNCTSLTEITLPNSVTEILEGTFCGDTKLQQINNTAQLTSIGAHAFRKTSLKRFEMPASVTRIEQYTFADIPSLETVVLNNVTNIGNMAFGNSSLSSMRFEDSKTKMVVDKNAFSNTSIDDLYIGCNFAMSATPFANSAGLKRLEIGGYKLTVTDGEFKGCTNLERLMTGHAVASIGAEAFSGCKNLTDVTLGDNITTIKHHAFYNSGISILTFPRYWNVITEYSFAKCENLTSVDIAPSISKIEGSAFAGSKLIQASLPPTVETIPESMFANCSQLEDIKLAEGNKYIGKSAFANTALKSITIPRSVVNIADGVFNGCKSLANVKINDGSGNLAVGVNSSGKGLFSDCKMTDLYIGRVLKYDATSGSGYSPFYDLSTLENVTLGDIPTEIYRYQFYKCSGLKTVEVGDAVTHIGEYAFSGCASLDEFTFGANISDLGPDAFSDCRAMSKMYAYPVYPPHCGAQALDDINKFDCTLFVPRQSTQRYAEADQWSDFFFTEEFDAGIVVSYIELTGVTSTLNVGQRTLLTAIVYPFQVADTPLHWSSSNPSVAVVDASGLVTALGTGYVEITAIATDGSDVSATYSIMVVDPNAPQPYRFTASNTAVELGKVTELPIEMINENAVVAFQCDILLPSGIEIQTDEFDDYDFTLSARADRSHVINSARLGNGAIRLIVYSMKNAAFSGNKGTLFNIPVIMTDKDLANEPLRITNINVTTSDYVDHFVNDISVNLTSAANYITGDANGDNRLTTADVAITVGYILEQNPAGFVMQAADTNGDNRITTADVAKIAGLVLTGSSSAPARVIDVEPAAEVDNEASMFTLAGTIDNEDTISVINLEINNADQPFVAFQCDLVLPEGIEIVCDEYGDYEVSPTYRAKGHIFSAEYVDNGNAFRIVAYSMKNREFEGNDGAVAEIKVKTKLPADDYIAIIKNALITSPDYIDYESSPAEVTLTVIDASGVESVEADKFDGEKEYYNLQGIKMSGDNLKPGVYIVVEGSRTYKILVK